MVVLGRRAVSYGRGNPLIRNSADLGPYDRAIPRALWWSYSGWRFLISGSRVQGSGFGAQSSGFRVQSSDARVQGTRFPCTLHASRDGLPASSPDSAGWTLNDTRGVATRMSSTSLSLARERDVGREALPSEHGTHKTVTARFWP